MSKKRAATLILCSFVLTASPLLYLSCTPAQPPAAADHLDQVRDRMMAEFGDSHSVRISRGVEHVASLWRDSDGTQEDFENFCLENFIDDKNELDRAAEALERNFEILWGHLRQINRDINLPFVHAWEEPTMVDRYFRQSLPSTDLYGSKLAFFIALNFPTYTLQEKLEQGETWSRADWAKARIGDMFPVRIPSEISRQRGELNQARGGYTSNYFINMGRTLNAKKETLFPEGTKLHSHNGLRNTLKDHYTKDNGLERQRLIYQVAKRISEASIPKEVIDSDKYFWEPESNQLFEQSGEEYQPIVFESEGPERYRILHSAFLYQLKIDPYYPDSPTFIDRIFDNRQMPEKTVERLILDILEAPQMKGVAALMQKRLGRPLEPFDFWYTGFQAQGKWPAEKLNKITLEKYPDPAAFQADLPNILMRLGFPQEQANFLGGHAIVVPIRSGGNASGPNMQGDKARLRIPFTKEGLIHQGFRTGMHELGHTMHQNLAFHGMDHYFLTGVPMNGFAEAFAEILAYRNIEALGLDAGDNTEERDLQALANFRYVCEHGALGLTEMRVWRWMYAHPDCTREELGQTVREIARGVWNEFFAPYYGDPDSTILSIYNHMMGGSFYLHNYFLGNIIMFQIYDYLQGKDFASEVDRMLKQGKVTPDLWMKGAVGDPISAEPLLQAVSVAVERLER